MGPMKGGQGLLPNPPTGIVHKDEGLSHHRLSLFYFYFSIQSHLKHQSQRQTNPV